MNRPYPTYAGTSRGGRYDDFETDVVDYDRYRDRDAAERYGDAFDADYGSADHDEDYDDDVYEYVEPLDRRWIWVAGAAGAVLLVAVICTIVILGGGDSGSVSATVSSSTAAPATSATASALPSRTPSMTAPSTPLPPETVTTVAPSPTAQAAPVAPPVVTVPPAAAPPGTITYRVTGTRPLIDLVTVIYTDGQGALQTDVNVALPWTKAVTLDPGVTLGSVTATSLTGQLNCTIADAGGAVVAAQTNNSMIATCTK